MPTQTRSDGRAGFGADDGRRPKPRFTSGRECWVFSVSRPDELPGYHPELIGGLLEPGESLHYLLYTPLYEASAAPFGVRGHPGSHALAVTDTRFLLSRDPHRDGAGRSARAIPFDRVLRVELGHALVLAWMVIHFAESDRVESETVFFRSSGSHHLQAAVRAFRSRKAPELSLHADEAWRAACARSPLYLRDDLPRIVLEGEPTLEVVRSSERWGGDGRGRRRAPRCVSPAGIAALSPRALFVAQSESPSRPGGLAFGVNATAVERAAIRRCGMETGSRSGTDVARLLVDVGDREAFERLELPFDEESACAAERLMALLSGAVVRS